MIWLAITGIVWIAGGIIIQLTNKYHIPPSSTPLLPACASVAYFTTDDGEENHALLVLADDYAQFLYVPEEFYIDLHGDRLYDVAQAYVREGLGVKQAQEHQHTTMIIEVIGGEEGYTASIASLTGAPELNYLTEYGVQLEAQARSAGEALILLGKNFQRAGFLE